MSFWNRPRLSRWRVDVADLADVAAVDDLLDLADRRRVEEGVPDHEDEPLALGDGDQFLALRGRRGHRLLDEDVLAGEERRLGEREVEAHRGGDDHRVDLLVIDQLVSVRDAFDARVERGDVAQALRVEIADCLQAAVWQAVEIADEVRSPVATADDADREVLALDVAWLVGFLLEDSLGFHVVAHVDCGLKWLVHAAGISRLWACGCLRWVRQT